MEDDEIETYEDDSREEKLETWDGRGEPVPSMFEDYNQYVDAKVKHEISKVAPSVASTIQGQQQPVLDVADDEYRADRERAIQWTRDCVKKAVLADADGKPKEARDWRQRAKWGEDDLEKIPPSKGQLEAERLYDEFEGNCVDLLFDPEHKNDPIFESPRMQHDSAIVIARQNERNKKGLVRLPIEDSPHGNILPCKPRNMISFQLSRDQAESFKREVYDSGGSDHPDAIFKRSWQWLHTNGVWSHGKRAFEPEEKPKEEKREKAKAEKKTETLPHQVHVRPGLFGQRGQ